LQYCLGALTFLEPLVDSAQTGQHKKMRRLKGDNRQATRTFATFHSRAVDRLLARLKSGRLDNELASGTLPQSSRLHAARADQLISPSFRTELAGNWEQILQIATGQAAHGRGRFVQHRDRISEAEPQIRELISTLRAPSPVSVRGVAAASQLLTDGTGPLYNPLLTSKTVLGEAVTVAISLLDSVQPPTN